MKTLKGKLLAAAIGSALSLYSVNVNAGGIPVIDAASIAQQVTNSVKELAEMAKQLAEAKKQLETMKQNVKALTGFKGFVDDLKGGGLMDEITSSFDDLMNGSPSDLISKSEKYFEANDNLCKDAKDSELCKKASLASIAQIDFAEKLDKQIQEKLDRIAELSEKAKETEDMKSIAELQANIQLEGNSIALIMHQMNNFDRLQQAQKEIAAKQAHEKYIKEDWEGFGKGSAEAGNKKLSNLSSLLN